MNYKYRDISNVSVIFDIIFYEHYIKTLSIFQNDLLKCIQNQQQVHGLFVFYSKVF